MSGFVTTSRLHLQTPRRGVSMWYAFATNHVDVFAIRHGKGRRPPG